MSKLKNKKAFTLAEIKNRHSEARSAEESIMKSDSSLPLRMTGRKAAWQDFENGVAYYDEEGCSEVEVCLKAD